MKKIKILPQDVENIVKNVIKKTRQSLKTLKEQEEAALPDDYEAPFTGEDFVKYIHSEWDLEMLDLIIDVTMERRTFIENLLHNATRKEIRGFGRGNNPIEEE